MLLKIPSAKFELIIMLVSPTNGRHREKKKQKEEREESRDDGK